MAEKDLHEEFAGIRQGNRDAFVRVYQQLKQPVYTIVYRISQSRETAEDITHDVFVKLYTSPPDPSVQNLRAWIFRMARNLAIDTLRKRQPTMMQEETLTDDAITKILLKMDLESAMAILPENQREILALHLHADLGFREIGDIVGLSLPATYRLYRKALKQLRITLNGG